MMFQRSSASSSLLLSCTEIFAVKNDAFRGLPDRKALNWLIGRNRRSVGASVAEWSGQRYMITRLNELCISMIESGEKNAVERSVEQKQQRINYSTDTCIRNTSQASIYTMS